MWRVSVRRDFEDEDAIAAAADGYPVLGIEFEHHDGGLTEFVIWLRDGAAAQRLADLLGGAAAEVDEPVFVETPREPMAVGEIWWLIPPGWTGPTPGGRHAIEFRTGNSFGQGDHPTTQLCLIALERHFLPGERFLDVGCGSGLLMEAARRMGAWRAWGCDPDPVARPDWFGSVDALADDAVDFAIANVPPGVFDAIWPDLERTVGRILVVCGFPEDHAPPVRSGWETAGRLTGAGWTALVWKRIQSR
jgi:ribosomal protein L11 methyltransferase